MARTLKAIDKVIQGAAYLGQGTSTEYRIDGTPGLILRVGRPARSGRSSKVWVCRYSVRDDGRRADRKLKIGVYPGVKLAEARAKAAQIMSRVEAGEDPIGEDIAARAEAARVRSCTFADLVEDYLADQRKEGVKSVGELERALRRDALPALGDTPAAEVTDVQIEAAVDAVDARGSRAMARHLLTYIRGVFNHALDGSPRLRDDYGLTHNPANRVGRGRRGKPGRYGRPGLKDRVLSDEEIVQFWRALETSSIAASNKLALQLLLVTGQRPGEVRMARQSELTLAGNAPVWRLPGERTKNGRAHTLPLAPLAVRFFEEALALHDDRDIVFASNQTANGIVGHHALRQALQRLFEKGVLTCPRFTPHDLRRTVGSGLARLGIQHDIIERVLNHAPRGVTQQHYLRHDYQVEMRAALERWGEHLQALADS